MNSHFISELLGFFILPMAEQRFYEALVIPWGHWVGVTGEIIDGKAYFTV